MQCKDSWIWLPEDIYPNDQATVFSAFSDKSEINHTVAEFKKEYVFSKKVVQAQLRFSGDAVFQLFLNGNAIATGPACVGGDFIGNETKRNNFYAFEMTVFPQSSTLDFFARVNILPYHICEYSMGHGGFMLSAVLTFEDGTIENIKTDENWLVRKNGAFNAPMAFDGRILPDEYVNAQTVDDIWNASVAPIPPRFEEELFFDEGEIFLLPLEEKTVVLELDKIWGGFLKVESKNSATVEVAAYCREADDSPEPEVLIFNSPQSYRGFSIHSTGNIKLTAKNTSQAKACIKVSFIKTHYPVYEEATTVTSDNALNSVLEVCKHTLKICRQTHHLDSTRHCEPLACTGDYYIESLMTPFSFGDMRLAEFDILRTAVLLERENGRMFHTTYSLIWVKMLYETYMLTGNLALLNQSKKALDLLLMRFEEYMGENGIIDNPPDYMFIDWIYIDGLSMHHPPKALGQSCLNMFYFGALDNAKKIYGILGENDSAQKCHKKRECLRNAINSLLYNKEKDCYFEGLNTPEDAKGIWLPQNVEKRYYLKHSNILAAYFGVCDESTGRSLIHKIMADNIEGDCQPYFLHYLLEAVYRLGLRKEYTLKILDKWKEPVRIFPKGLVEGFIAPEPTYSFDHSHAWGGTPLYSLPKAVLGIEIIEPKMKKIRLSPDLLGLSYVNIELLTPYGKITYKQSEGTAPILTYPPQIKITLAT